MSKVQCNHCMTVFDEEEIQYRKYEEHCPNCQLTGGLMDLEEKEA